MSFRPYFSKSPHPLVISFVMGSEHFGQEDWRFSIPLVCKYSLAASSSLIRECREIRFISEMESRKHTIESLFRKVRNQDDRQVDAESLGCCTGALVIELGDTGQWRNCLGKPFFRDSDHMLNTPTCLFNQSRGTKLFNHHQNLAVGIFRSVGPERERFNFCQI